MKVHRLCFKEPKNCLLWFFLLENQQEWRSTSFILSSLKTLLCFFGFCFSFITSGKSARIKFHKLCFKESENPQNPLVFTPRKSAGLEFHKLCCKQPKNCLLCFLFFFTASGKSARIKVHKPCFKEPETCIL